MISLGFFVLLHATLGMDKYVAAFFKHVFKLENLQTTTPVWFGLRLGPTTFGVFDAFHDEPGRQTHINGPIAQALMANAADLLAAPPSIEKTEILGVKLPQEVGVC